jgi:DNA mismatch repair protein MSH3
LPKLRTPIKGFIASIRIDQAAEGKKELMWTEPDKFPGLVDAAVVRACLYLVGLKLI